MAVLERRVGVPPARIAIPGRWYLVGARSHIDPGDDQLAQRTKSGLTALIGALTLVGGLLLAAAAPAIAPPGGIEQFPFSSPNDYPYGGLTAGSDGNVWFTERSLNEGAIALMTQEGKITEYPIPTEKPVGALPEFSYPQAIAQGPGGELWFTETGTNSASEELIGQVTLKSGGAPQIKEFPLPTGNYPNQIAAGPEGNMWFTAGSSSGGKVWRITPAGVLTPYTIPVKAASSVEPEFSSPVGIAQGPGGYMWFADQGVNDEGKPFVDRINTSTGQIEEFPIPTKYGYPSGIAEGANGDMWFTESPSVSQIGEITPTGEIKEFPVPSTSGSSIGIAPGPDGNMWFTEEVNDAIGRIAASGEVKQFSIPTRGSNPQAIVKGPDGNMWFIEQTPTEVSPTSGLFFHIGRLTTPFLPANTALPTISGTATQGQALTASQGSWSNNPSAFAYQWQDCDAAGNNCTNLSGETGVTHFLTAGDVGHTLRVVVMATDVAGSATAASVQSSVVSAPPPPPKVTPRVESSMTWTFGWSRKFTIVESLIVHEVPKGGRVEVICHGHGCPFVHHYSATVARHQTHQRSCHGHQKKCNTKRKPPRQGPEVSLTSLFKGRHLKVGASITVDVVKAGWIGKSFVFATRPGRSPHVQIECLAPGSHQPGKAC
jgi:virginiamycin B lyase